MQIARSEFENRVEFENRANERDAFRILLLRTNWSLAVKVSLFTKSVKFGRFRSTSFELGELRM